MNEKYKAKRAELKYFAGDLEGLQKLPRNSSPTRLKNRDMLDEAAHVVICAISVSAVSISAKKKASKRRNPRRHKE